MTADRFTRRQLNRATLQRQLLLQRSTQTAVGAVEHLVGLQAQAPLAPYVALWSRLQGFDPVVLASDLEHRAVVRTHVMRATIHLLSIADALELRALTQPVLARSFSGQAFARSLDGLDLDDVLTAANRLLGRTPLTRLQLGRALAEQFPGWDPGALSYAVTYLLPLVQVPPRGVWGQSAPAAWKPLEDWLGRPLSATPSVDRAVLRYLAAFGPASVADARVWSGLPRLREVFDRLRPRLRTFRSPDGAELFDLPHAPRPDLDLAAPVRFLPEYDNLLLSHADRTRVIPDRRPVPLPPGEGARAGTVLVDGELRATWRLVRQDATATLHVVADPPPSSTEEADTAEEGMRLLELLAPAADQHEVIFEVTSLAPRTPRS